MYILVAASERRVGWDAAGGIAAADGAIAGVVAGTVIPATEAVAEWDVAR
jgi:hypothetical protein